MRSCVELAGRGQGVRVDSPGELSMRVVSEGRRRRRRRLPQERARKRDETPGRDGRAAWTRGKAGVEGREGRLRVPRGGDAFTGELEEERVHETRSSSGRPIRAGKEGWAAPRRTATAAREKGGLTLRACGLG